MRDETAARHAPLVGRAPQLLALERAVDAGVPATLVVGDAGVGKTRLVAALAGRLAGRRRLVAGSCLPMSIPSPMLALSDLVRLLADASTLATLPAWVPAELARLVPELAGGSGAPEPAEGWWQQRLLAALGELLHHVADTHVVVVEDLHWAEPATLDALQFLLRPSAPRICPLVLTVREDQPTWLRTILDRLVVLGPVQRLSVPELSEAETGELIDRLTGVKQHGRTARQVYARSGGNPLYTEQLVLGVTDRRDAVLPQVLDGLLRERVASVDEPAQAVLVALAVNGAPLDATAIAIACDLPPGQLTAPLHELQRRGLVRTDAAGVVRLRHALLAEVIDGDAPGASRRDVAARLARVHLAAGPPHPPTLPELLRQAGRSVEELEQRIIAGRRALAMFAATEADAHLTRALVLWRALPPTTLDTEASLGLFTLSWTAAERAGDTTAATAIADEALARLGDVLDGRQTMSVHLALGRLRKQHEADQAHQHFAFVISHADVEDSRRELVRAHREEGALLLSRGDLRRARSHIVRAHRLSRAGSDDTADRVALLIDAWLLAALDRPLSSSWALQAALRSVPDDPFGRVELAARHTDLLLDTGRLAEAVTVGREAVALAERTGLGGWYWTVITTYNLVEALLERGDVSEAAEVVAGSDVPVGPVESAVHGLLRAAVDLRTGAVDAAAAYWSDAVFTEPWMTFQREIALHRLEYASWTGGGAQALDATFPALERICRTDQARFVGALLAAAMRACADLAEQARADGLPFDDRDVRRLRTLAGDAPVDPFGPPGRYCPRAAAAHGASWRAEAARVAGAPATHLWAEAADAWSALGRPHRTGYARWRHAAGLADEAGARTELCTSVRSAAAAASTHQPLREAITGTARRLAVPLGPTKAGYGAGPAALTAREREVLALVVAGCSNPQIARRLGMSTKTASVHVSSILRKLGAGSRVQAAVLAAGSTGGAPADGGSRGRRDRAAVLLHGSRSAGR